MRTSNTGTGELSRIVSRPTSHAQGHACYYLLTLSIVMFLQYSNLGEAYCTIVVTVLLSLVCLASILIDLHQQPPTKTFSAFLHSQPE